jgi:hypothetical protein
MAPAIQAGAIVLGTETMKQHDAMSKNTQLSLFALVLAASVTLGSRAESSQHLNQLFQSPPREAQPWVFWVWTGDLTRAVITRDLEQMKVKGTAGCILYECQSSRGHNWWDRTVVLSGKDYRAVPTSDYPNPYYTPVPTARYVTWAAHWRELVRFAAAEAARFQLDYALTISDQIVTNHYGHLNTLAEEHGLVLHSEAAGPNCDWADLHKTSRRVADAMAEFWTPSAHRPTMDSRFLLRNAASANHV